MSQVLLRSVSRYYEEIGRTTPVADPDEERRLILRWQKNKDAVARDILLKGHLRFVVTMARRRSKDPDRLQDLIAAGNLGLVKALDRYDLSRRPPVRFLTYAGSWINKEMLDNDYATSSLVHVPTHRQKAQRKKAKEFQRALQEHGPTSRKTKKLDPGLPEGVTVALDDLREVLENRRYFGDPASRGTRPHWLTDNDVAQMSDSLRETVDTDKVLRRAIALLPHREQVVLNLYFGIKDDCRNLVQIAALLEMSPERVRQIKISGVKQLKDILAEKHAVTSPNDAY